MKAVMAYKELTRAGKVRYRLVVVVPFLVPATLLALTIIYWSTK